MRILIAADEPRGRQRLKQIVTGLASAVYEAGDQVRRRALCSEEPSAAAAKDRQPTKPNRILKRNQPRKAMEL